MSIAGDTDIQGDEPTFDPTLDTRFVVLDPDDLPAAQALMPDAEVLTAEDVLGAKGGQSHPLDGFNVAVPARLGVAADLEAIEGLRKQLRRKRIDLLKLKAAEIPGWADGQTLDEYARKLNGRVEHFATWLYGLADFDADEPAPKPKSRPSANSHHAITATVNRNVITVNGSGPKRPFNLTDLGNAERLAARHGDDLRYVYPWNKWLVWDGRRWATDASGQVGRAAKDTVRSIYAEAAAAEDDELRKALVAHGRASETAKSINAMVALARSELPVEIDALDRDPWLLNVLNGTLDLRTGELRPHRREDHITKLCPVPYDPDAECPVWDSTLGTIFQANDRLIAFVQRLCGIALTGDVSEQMLAIFYGCGANGKSTVLNVMLDLLGEGYAMKAPQELLTVKRSESHPTERASLFGKRLVVAIETGEGARLNETLIKELTGSDKISARRMREDFWEFHPTHTLVMATNHKPEVRGTDHAIWRRLKLVPFAVTIPDDQQDRNLPAKLAKEFPGILAWAVRGCLAWREAGLNPPAEVADATKEYREEQDVIAAFLAEECVIVGPATVKASLLFERYRQWTERTGESAAKRDRFGAAMTERGFERYHNNGTWYRGIGLRAGSPGS